jgi:ribonuclease HII
MTEILNVLLVAMPSPHFNHERKAIAGDHIVCGVDEAGRGPWAGPVVAAAVVLNAANIPEGLNDSKKLNEKKREVLFDAIIAVARVGVGIVSAARIDEINILQATFEAMGLAVDELDPLPTLALVDGNRAPPLACQVQTLVGGDATSLSIAAASIIAKVTRDRMMQNLHKTYPAYGFDAHKGYGTAMHAAALAKYGPCPEHRKSFKPIMALRSR